MLAGVSGERSKHTHKRGVKMVSALASLIPSLIFLKPSSSVEVDAAALQRTAERRDTRAGRAGAALELGPALLKFSCFALRFPSRAMMCTSIINS